MDVEVVLALAAALAAVELAAAAELEAHIKMFTFKHAENGI
tara:strand:+ start:114 stop:236 length:123 start_codon:yes stop_codon:yes gene_type:complete